MGYIFIAPPATAAKKNGQLSGYLGDTCVIQPNGARVCSSDSAPPVITAPPPVITPLPPTPASCPPCPPQMACPTPSPCPPCATRLPILPPRPLPPVVIRPTPMPVTPKPIVPTPVMRPISPAGGGFARYSQLAQAARARLLEGLGDTCQVYANGARVCNAAPPAPATVPAPPMTTVCTNEAIPGPNYMMMTARPAGGGAYPYGGPLPPVRTPVRTRRVCRQVAAPTPSAVPAAVPVPYTTSTVNPVVDNTTLPAAPVPADSTSASSTFDISSVPSWAWYLLAGGGVYFLFFRKR
jgi:hypothetical protein